MYRRDGREVLVSLDARTGATRWEFAYDVSFSREYSMENGEGPHATPLIAGTRVLAVGSTGRLHALDKDTGKLLWAHDLTNELGGFIRVNGYACSPLAFEQLVVHTVGGQSGAVVAFDQSTGRIVWQSERDRISPSSPILIDVDGDAQLVALLYDRLVGLDPRTGATRWSHPHESDFGLNVSTPVWTPDSTLVVSSASNGDFGPAPFTCLDAGTGTVVWRQRGIARVTGVRASNGLLLLDEDGRLVLAGVTREGLTIRARAAVMAGTSWTVPTVVGTRVYVRDRRMIKALELG
jgi:outer membrane protein assembly factor BamB